MHVIYRQDQEAQQSARLSSQAAHTYQSKGRAHAIKPDILRNDYQRDRDRILHSKAFRRLSHKTQVFLAAQGDHFRTRLTHTLEVAQIARTIARALSLNEDLTEAIALGHDLGHTPFGHTGEDALAKCLATCAHIKSESKEARALFRHNAQSLRVVEHIENDGRGLNLTTEVRDGILHHTGSERPKTLEGRIVAVADRIAYVNHDIDDAIRAGILSESDLPESTHAILGENHSARIQTLVLNMVKASAQKGDICLDTHVWDAMMELRAFLFEHVYESDMVMAEVQKATRLLSTLFNYYYEHIDEVPSEYMRISKGDNARAVVDYIAGMTDRFAKTCFDRLFIPNSIVNHISQ